LGWDLGAAVGGRGRGNANKRAHCPLPTARGAMCFFCAGPIQQLCRLHSIACPVVARTRRLPSLPPSLQCACHRIDTHTQPGSVGHLEPEACQSIRQSINQSINQAAACARRDPLRCSLLAGFGRGERQSKQTNPGPRPVVAHPPPRDYATLPSPPPVGLVVALVAPRPPSARRQHCIAYPPAPASRCSPICLRQSGPDLLG